MIKRLTIDDTGTFDELVADNASVHIERMSDDCVWMTVRSEGREITLNFWNLYNVRIVVDVEEEAP